ncbi:hypothetical protein ABT124_41650 [Streptomyces sp. NPDC001982]|uniref:hypothetical protein n=1 Tax=Streptomyces sp. NPDC001982 TaxID=3154405 RepID=UPI003324C9E8
MDAGETFLVIVPTLMATGALVVTGLIVRSWHRTRAVLRDGERVPGRCVRIYTSVSNHGENHATSRQHFVVEYAVPGGATHRIDDATLPSTTCEGDLLTVAYDAATGLACAASVAALARSGRLTERMEPQLAPVSRRIREP